MANIAHSVLAGTEIHEPKGVADASLGQVYVADGNGSGSWSSIGASSFTGMISDFPWPVVQDGWLECDGSDINITTYGTLFSVMTIQGNGTRTSGSAVITSLSSTSNMRVGYYIYGTGIPVDTTITQINSATQVTMSANASSTGTTTVIVSPWRMGVGTIRLPDLSAAGRYRRSRTSTTRVGELQSSQNLSHAHTGSGNTGTVSNDHVHGFNGTTSSTDVDHTHTFSTPNSATAVNAGADKLVFAYTGGTSTTSGQSNGHTHTYSGSTGGVSSNHTHAYSFTTSSSGSSEARPTSIVLMTCVKT